MCVGCLERNALHGHRAAASGGYDSREAVHIAEKRPVWKRVKEGGERKAIDRQLVMSYGVGDAQSE